MYPVAPTLEQNGHGASIMRQFNDINIKEENHNNLPHRKRIWFHSHKNNSIFGDFYMTLVQK